MLDPKAVHRLLVHLEAAGLLYPASGEDVAEARLRMWSVAMNVDGVSEPEATYAAMLVSRRPQSDRPRVIAPGDLLEAIYSERMKLQRSALALEEGPTLSLEERRAIAKRGLDMVRAAVHRYYPTTAGGEDGKVEEAEP